MTPPKGEVISVEASYLLLKLDIKNEKKFKPLLAVHFFLICLFTQGRKMCLVKVLVSGICRRGSTFGVFFISIL